MQDDCKGVQNWFNCLNCYLLSTQFCPLEGDDAVDRIANKIRMMEDPSFDGYRKELGFKNK